MIVPFKRSWLSDNKFDKITRGWINIVCLCRVSGLKNEVCYMCIMACCLDAWLKHDYRGIVTPLLSFS